MSTINTSMATNPFIAKSENSASSSIVKFDTKLFDNIDSKAETRSGDTINFSSKAQFIFNLRSHAHTLSDAERNQFANALEQSGDEMFDEDFLRWIRDPPTITVKKPEKNESVWPLLGNSAANDSESVVKRAADSGLIVNYVGLIVPWELHSTPNLGDIHTTDHLTNQLDELTLEASRELSDQDLAVVTGTMSRAVQNSRNLLNSTFALFETNYCYEEATEAFSKLPMSDELKGKYSNLLSNIRSFQSQLISDHIDQQEKKLQQIQNMPQYAVRRDMLVDNIRRDIKTNKEGLDINNYLQQSISHSKGGLLGLEDHFQSLISNAEHIKRASSDEISDRFVHYTKQLDLFDRVLIEKDWGVKPNQIDQTRNQVLRLVGQETKELSDQYIAAINSYLANTKN